VRLEFDRFPVRVDRKIDKPVGGINHAGVLGSVSSELNRLILILNT
jgi:hypothetical protein